MPYIWEQPDWPQFRYDAAALAAPLADVAMALGVIQGRMEGVGFDQRNCAALEALTLDVVKTSEIEGDKFDPEAVRSSLARRLGMDVGALAPADRHVDGVVDMVLDATGPAAPLTARRLCNWQAALFPTGRSGLHEIRVGQWRDDGTGPMQVVSGPHHRPRVHFQAPPAARLDHEMQAFLRWFEHDQTHPPLIKAGLAHLWFVTVHPFDDGNGRVARAVGDLALTRADGMAQRFYSLSAQIQRDRKGYYDVLEATQKGDLEVTAWLLWFLRCLREALTFASSTLDSVLAKARFWQTWAGIAVSDRQAKVLNRVLDGIDAQLTNRKWAKLAGVSSDTALRDLSDLVEKGMLVAEGEGRGRTYATVIVLNA